VTAAVAAAIVVVAGCLAPPAVSAQTAAPPSGPAPVAPRLEVVALGGVAGTSPEVGALVSLPAGRRVSLDIGASYLARVFRSPAFLLSQAQLRIPFRAHQRSRYGVLVGVTYLDELDPREGDSPLWRQDLRRRLFPHAGASLQWRLGRHADLRVDAQLVVQGGELIPVAPRAVAGIGWHP
jgi:hypothetical protein